MCARDVDEGGAVSGQKPAIRGIDHVQITVPRGEEAAVREFYCGVLGLPEIEKPDALKPRGGFWLAVGDRELHVGTEDGVNRRATKAAHCLRRRRPRLLASAADKARLCA